MPIRTLKRVLQRHSVTCLCPGRRPSRYEHRIGEFTASSNRHLPSRHRMQPTCVSRGTNRLVAQGGRIKPNIVDQQLIFIQFLNNSMLSLTSRFHYCMLVTALPSLLPAYAVRPIISSKPPLPIERPLVHARTFVHLPTQPAGRTNCISRGGGINVTDVTAGILSPQLSHRGRQRASLASLLFFSFLFSVS